MFGFTSDQVIEIEAQHQRKSVEVIAYEVGLEPDAVTEALEVVRILPDLRAGRNVVVISRARGLQVGWLQSVYELMTGSL